MDSILTPVRILGINGDKTYTVSFGAVEKHLLGKQVELFHKRHKIAVGYVHELKTVSLTDVTDKDLARLHKAFRRKDLFWKKMEGAYGGGLPGEFKITLVTLSDEPAQLTPRRRRTVEFPPVAHSDTNLEARSGTVSLKELLEGAEESED